MCLATELTDRFLLNNINYKATPNNRSIFPDYKRKINALFYNENVDGARLLGHPVHSKNVHSDWLESFPVHSDAFSPSTIANLSFNS